MLTMKNVTIEFQDTIPPTKVVHDVSLQMKKGEIVGIVGESGSGKTMMALALMGLLESHAWITGSELSFEGQNLLTHTRQEWEGLRGNGISMIFQEPMTSLNPVLPIGEQVEESLKLHTKLDAKERKQRALVMMEEVELQNPEELYHKYPHQLSGGMRQRVMIAAALIAKPRLMIADEPTTALDVTIQAQILKLLKKINREQGTAILFISHDLGVVRKLCERVVVMQAGKVVEEGSVEEVFRHPKADYTKRLIAAIPNRSSSLRRERHV